MSLGDRITVRNLAIVLGSISLAVLLLFQSLSLVLFRTSPAAAVALWPWNGMARARTAAISVTLSGMKGGDRTQASRRQLDAARRAFASDPLSTQALDVVIMSQQPRHDPSAVLNQALLLDRRDITLQGLALEQQLASRDLVQIIATLDRVLRVHEEQWPVVFPLLKQALTDKRAIPAFARIFDGQQDWQIAFLRSAALDPKLAENLAHVRLMVNVNDGEFDRRLIRQLANKGDYETAYRLYHLIRLSKTSGLDLGWEARIAPFEWSLASDGAFHAQRGPSGQKLELYAESAHNGVAASRVVSLNAPFMLELAAAGLPELGHSGVTLNARCAGTDRWLLNSRLVNGVNRFVIRETGEDCGFYEITLNVRAAIGEPAIDAMLGPMMIRSDVQDAL